MKKFLANNLARIQRGGLVGVSLAGASLILAVSSGARLSTWAASAALTFSPASGVKTVGADFSVAVQLDTGGAQTDGARAVINYDASKLEVRAISDGVYDSYPTKTWANGKITISGLAPINGPYYNGSGNLATITFRAKSSGTTTLSFDYTAGSTTDSNVAEHGTNADVLASVGTATFTLQSASGATLPTPTSTVSSSGPGQTGGGSTPTTQELPNAGVSWVSWLVALVAASFVSVGTLLIRRV